MDMDMDAFLREAGDAGVAAPEPDAPADYLHQRAQIIREAMHSVADGEHPADALSDMERRLEIAARPVASTALMVWAPARVGV